MSKQHIDSMSKAVKTYFAAAQNAAAKIGKNNTRYREDIAAEENAKVRGQLEAARREAESAIREAQEAGRADAFQWGKLSGADVTDDAKLLQMQLTPDQFSDLVGRYKSNGTMSAMLAQYGEKRNKDAGAEFGPYDLTQVPTAEKKAAVYDRFAMSALDLIDYMDRDKGIMSGVDSPMLQEAVEQFGKPSAFNQELFDLL